MVTNIDKLIVMVQIKSQTAIQQINKINKSMDALEKRTNGFLQGIQKAMLALGLAFLFTGMALKRFFDNAVLSIAKVFMLANGETGPLSEAVNELKAKFYALAYQIVSTFVETGGIDKWSERVEWLMDKVEELDNKLLEATGNGLFEFLIWGAIAATAMMVVGMAILFMLGPLGILDFLLGTTLVASIASFFVAWGPLILLIVGIGLAIAALWRMKDAMGGFRNFAKAALAGLAKSFAWLVGNVLENVIQKITNLVHIFQKLAFAVGADSVGSALSDVVNLGDTLRRAVDAENLMKKVDDFFGMGAIRSNMSSTTLGGMLWNGASNYNQNGVPTNQAPIDKTPTSISINVLGGMVDNATINQIIKAIEQEISFSNGSPQG